MTNEPKLISTANNPGCQHCIHRMMGVSVLLPQKCNVKYKGWDEDPIASNCSDSNINGSCTDFEATLLFKAYSLFSGRYRCFAFGHKMEFVSNDCAGPSKCKRKNCEYTEPGIEWPKPPPRKKDN